MVSTNSLSNGSLRITRSGEAEEVGGDDDGEVASTVAVRRYSLPWSTTMSRKSPVMNGGILNPAAALGPEQKGTFPYHAHNSRRSHSWRRGRVRATSSASSLPPLAICAAM